jgi:hypothetical protein
VIPLGLAPSSWVSESLEPDAPAGKLDEVGDGESISPSESDSLSDTSSAGGWEVLWRSLRALGRNLRVSVGLFTWSVSPMSNA